MSNYITNKGIFIDANTLNEYEKEHKRLSYRTAWDRLTNKAPLVLCNNIINIDDTLLDNLIMGDLYDPETDEEMEVYQWYITDLSQWDLDWLEKNGQDNFIILYSELLDCYILAVTHWGTAWDYVLTDIEIKEA